MKQVDLFGFDVMECRKCSRCFGTMEQSSRHHSISHRKITSTRTSINFTLENYCLISEKITTQTKSNLCKVRGGDQLEIERELDGLFVKENNIPNLL